MKTKLLLTLFTVSLLSIYSQNPVTQTSGDWDVKYLFSPSGIVSLANPYEVTVGPDGWLWITERASSTQDGSQTGERIIRVNPAVGSKINNGEDGVPGGNDDEYEYAERDELIDLSSEVFSNAGQDGLMGLAIHPALYNDITTTTNNYVYTAYTYGNSSNRKLKIVRLIYTHNGGTNPTLTIDTSLNGNGSLIEDIDASNDHNSGRLKIGPDMKLYYSVGDQGSNQFKNAFCEIRSQYLPTVNTDKSDYKGKILRMELDGSIPGDNPLLGESGSEIRSHIYSYGHRNPQGLVFDSLGNLFSSEHGPKTDDELNVIESGKNYGWPHVAGFDDDEYYSYCNWSTQAGGGNTCPDIDSQNTDHSCISGATDDDESDWANPANYKDPIGTIGSTITVAEEPSYDFTSGWLTWPTVAPASIDIYEEALYPTATIPDWHNSLLIPTLKEGTIFRAQLNATRDDIVGDDHLDNKVGYEEFHSSNDRYRDLAFDPNGNGLSFYAILDSKGATSGPSGTSNVGIDHHGAIAVFTYTGSTVLATETLTTDSFEIFPNPTIEVLNISSPNNSDYSYRIINILGKTQLEGFVNASRETKRVDTSSLRSGIYIISVETENVILNKKLIIK